MSVLAPSYFTTGLHHRAVSSYTSQPARGTGLSCFTVPERPCGAHSTGQWAQPMHTATHHIHHWAQLLSFSAYTTQTGIRVIHVIQLHLQQLWAFLWMYFPHTHRQTHGQSQTNPPDLLSSPGKTTNKPLISSYCRTVPSVRRLPG